MTTNILFACIGLLLLVMGRRLFWFFVAAVGMTAGMEFAQQQMIFQPFIVQVALWRSFKAGDG